MSGWLEKPAGKQGFISVRDGHLFAGDRRFRFFGVNLVFGANFPKHGDAEKIAARMAKFGINCVRLHSLDEQPSPRGLLQQNQRDLDPGQLDKLDYLVAQLKAHGIYVDIVLHAGRYYPGFPRWDNSPLFFKGIDIFFQPMIDAQREYARALLSHKNPYTQLSYKDDPVVALLEINNENSLLYEWWSGRFDGMPDPYRADLQARWNSWQMANINGKSVISQLPPRNSFARLPTDSQRHWIEFLWELERAYWNRMESFLRKEIKSKSLIIGTQASYSPPQIQADMDLLDDHAYWQHPTFPGMNWDPENWTIKNIPMAGAPDGGTIPRLAFNRLIGKPFICTEYNHPAPNTYSSEAFLLLSGYAALQDWDGIFAFDYSKRTDDWAHRGIPNFFDIDRHSTQLVTFPAVAALFVRADIHSPQAHATLCISDDAAREHLRVAGPRLRPGDFGFSPLPALERPVGVAQCSAGTLPPPSISITEAVHDDLNQITWDPGGGKGIVIIDTSRTKALIGFLTKDSYLVGGITIKPNHALQGWAAITLTVLDGESVRTARRILLTATGYSENSDMKWKDGDKTSVGGNWGSGDVLVEGISAEVTLPPTGRKATVWSLNPMGQPMSRVAVDDSGEQPLITLSPENRTIWYEIHLD